MYIFSMQWRVKQQKSPREWVKVKSKVKDVIVLPQCVQWSAEQDYTPDISIKLVDALSGQTNQASALWSVAAGCSARHLIKLGAALW